MALATLSNCKFLHYLNYHSFEICVGYDLNYLIGNVNITTWPKEAEIQVLALIIFGQYYFGNWARQDIPH